MKNPIKLLAKYPGFVEGKRFKSRVMFSFAFVKFEGRLRYQRWPEFEVTALAFYLLSRERKYLHIKDTEMEIYLLCHYVALLFHARSCILISQIRENESKCAILTCPIIFIHEFCCIRLSLFIVVNPNVVGFDAVE